MNSIFIYLIITVFFLFLYIHGVAHTKYQKNAMSDGQVIILIFLWPLFVLLILFTLFFWSVNQINQKISEFY